MLDKFMLKVYTKGYSLIKKDNKGQSLVEYGLIIALIAVVAITALSGLGGKIQNTFKTIVNSIP